MFSAHSTELNFSNQHHASNNSIISILPDLVCLQAAKVELHVMCHYISSSLHTVHTQIVKYNKDQTQSCRNISQ